MDPAPRLKSLPDTAKIGAMTAPKISVVKHYKGPGNDQPIILGRTFEDTDQLWVLMEEVRRVGGPGRYTFNVTDESGDKDSWACQFTAAPGQPPQEGIVSDMGPSAGFPTASAPAPVAGSAPPQPGGVMNLGNGFYLTLFPHDPTKGILTTPQRGAIEWREGMPLPGMPGFTGGASAAPAYTGTFAGASPMPPTSGMDSYAMDLLRAERERTRDEQNQRREQELRSEFRTMIAETQKQFADIVEKVTARPAVSPEIEAIKQQNAELARRLEENQRQAQHDREIQALNTRMESMAAQMTAAIAAANNKPDQLSPLLSMFTQMTTSQSGSTTALLTAMKEASTVQAEAARDAAKSASERIMPPEKIMELLMMAKDKGPEHAVLLDGMQRMMGMWSELIKMRAELEPAGEPPWIRLVQGGLDQVGQLAQALMTRPTPTQPQQRPVYRQPPVQPPVQPQAQAPQAAGAPAAPTPQAPAPAPSRAAEPEVPVAPDVVIPPTAPPGTTAADVQNAYNELAAATPEAIRAMVAATPDEQFFGAVFPRIAQLRQNVAQDKMDENEVADAILQAQSALKAAGGARGSANPVLFPPAMELLAVGQLEVLIERLLPEEDAEFIADVVETLREKIGTVVVNAKAG